MTYTDFISQSLSDAATIATEQFGKVVGTTKPEDNNQVLTQTDIAIGKLLVESVKATYPAHNIIDEETGVIDNGSEYTWVIDPIDGTSNFVNGIPQYGTYIGLLYQDTPLAGGIGIPPLSEIYTAEKGKGAYCNGKQIHVSTETELKNVLVAYGIDAHPEQEDFIATEGNLLMHIVLQIRNLRVSNSAYDGALTAKGAYGAWLCRSSKVWDNVALQIVIEEAGGIYTDFFGNPIDYKNNLHRTKENFTYCAASPILHKQLQVVIHSCLSDKNQTK